MATRNFIGYLNAQPVGNYLLVYSVDDIAFIEVRVPVNKMDWKGLGLGMFYD